MKIRSHSQSHILELDDGTKWQIFPGDLDRTLGWNRNRADAVESDDEVASYN
ncbi:hypothetical protein [Bradyrhizobium sp. WSM2793]|uniref:hypothetical protein n=1 Tax=Bradyrhizobium sp. WSM2793 TaxID=1038866 RepID=UPI000364882B|nr:hypothetical protein [Bradyrhizobium sp. WSM2793]